MIGRTHSVMYGVDGTNIVDVKTVDAVGNAPVAATATVVLQL